MRVATRIPGGAEAEVRIWVCDGPSILTATDFEIDQSATINTDTGKASHISRRNRPSWIFSARISIIRS